MAGCGFGGGQRRLLRDPALFGDDIANGRVDSNRCSTVYVRLWTQIAGSWQTPFDYTFTASGARGYIYSPSNGSQLSASATFCWSLVGVPADYWLDVGTSQGVGDISAGFVTGTCKTVNNIPTGGKTIWVRLWTRAV